MSSRKFLEYLQVIELEKAPRMRIETMMNDLDLNDELFAPLEILFEILSSLPVMSLLRFKCVCKRWNELIQHPTFIKMHRIRSTEPISYYTSKNGATDVFKSLDSCHGLLVERSILSGMCRVTNPATKQILAIPDCKEKLARISNMMMVFLASTNSYKLVYVYQIHKGEIDKGEIWTGFKVLSFDGSDLSWRAIEKLYKCKFDRKGQRFCLLQEGHFIYVFAINEDGSSDSQICCLDVGVEMLRSPIIIPHCFLCLWENADTERRDGKVAVTHIVEEELHVRVLEDPIRQKWAEKMIIPLTFLKENPDMKEGFVPYSVSPKEVWLTKDCVSAIVYNTRSKQVLKSQVSEHAAIASGETCTLVKLKGMLPMNIDAQPTSNAAHCNLAGIF